MASETVDPSFVEFLGEDVSSVMDDLDLWDKAVKSQLNTYEYDVVDSLFGNDTAAILEELQCDWSELDENVNFENMTVDPKAPKQAKLAEIGSASSRFAGPTSSPERMKAARGVIPKNTKASTDWALRNFNSWAKNRKSIDPAQAVPPDLLSSDDPSLVCKWLCLYMMETRREDGQPYPPSTIRNLVSGLNRILQENKAPFSVLDRNDYRFRELSNTLDMVSSSLHREGIGVNKESAPIIEIGDEELFWTKGLLGTATPKLLQHTVFFYVGLNFVLRGVQEQYDLQQSQLKRVPPDVRVYNGSVYYEYTEYISKNNQHRFKDINASNKQVCCYSQPGSEHCLVKLLDMYFKYLPFDSSVFYLRPLARFPVDAARPAYGKQRVGVSTLKKIVPDMSKSAVWC